MISIIWTWFFYHSEITKQQAHQTQLIVPAVLYHRALLFSRQQTVSRV